MVKNTDIIICINLSHKMKAGKKLHNFKIENCLYIVTKKNKQSNNYNVFICNGRSFLIKLFYNTTWQIYMRFLIYKMVL